jgi:hypothetical protein
VGEVKAALRILWGRTKRIMSLKGPQASNARSPDKIRVKVKTLGWLETVASDCMHWHISSTKFFAINLYLKKKHPDQTNMKNWKDNVSDNIDRCIPE